MVAVTIVRRHSIGGIDNFIDIQRGQQSGKDSGLFRYQLGFERVWFEAGKRGQVATADIFGQRFFHRPADRFLIWIHG